MYELSGLELRQQLCRLENSSVEILQNGMDNPR